jgi:sulfide:quinone oxidoreductase
MSQTRFSSRPHVVIAGGGVAALEALIALRKLAGDGLRMTLVAPEPDFVYRPMATAEPFCLGRVTRHPLAAVARDFGAELVRAGLAEVEAEGRRALNRCAEAAGYARNTDGV